MKPDCTLATLFRNALNTITESEMHIVARADIPKYGKVYGIEDYDKPDEWYMLLKNGRKYDFEVIASGGTVKDTIIDYIVLSTERTSVHDYPHIKNPELRLLQIIQDDTFLYDMAKDAIKQFCEDIPCVEIKDTF